MWLVRESLGGNIKFMQRKHKFSPFPSALRDESRANESGKYCRRAQDQGKDQGKKTHCWSGREVTTRILEIITINYLLLWLRV